MKPGPTIKTALAVLVAMLVLPAASSAVYHVYRQGSATSKYTAAAYFNSSHRKLVTLTLTGKCDDDSRADVSSTNLKVSSSGKFSGSSDFQIYLYSTQKSYAASAKFSGKVKKRKYAKGKVEVTTDAPGCSGLSRSFKAKYKGTQTGG